MKKRYVGITIGPIIETMSYTSTPAGLWTASYFFSEITKSLYVQLNTKKYKVITVPDNVEDYHMEGIGQYHDRIYAVTPENGTVTAPRTDEEIAKDIEEIINTVIEEKAELVYDAFKKKMKTTINKEKITEDLKAYIQIHFIIKEVDDTQVLAKTLAEELDALENCQGVTGNLTKNPVVRLVSGENSDANCYIKKYSPFKNAKMLNIQENGEVDKVKDLSTLFQNQKYFAIVQADGDGMGKVVNAEIKKGESVSLEDQEKRIKTFSKLCMCYTRESSEIIRDFNGVVIYAGGDDLLFLAPVTSKLEDGDEGKNIWTLCQKIGKKFNEIFNPEHNVEASAIVSSDKVPSISFGVSINYYKFPLYEAFEDARNLLFGEAKNYGSKNNFAITLHKASGQSSGYVCCMESKEKSDDTLFQTIIDYCNLINKDTVSAFDNNQMLHSLLYHIENSKELYKLALNDAEKRKKYFDNVFDSLQQRQYKPYIDRVNKLADKVVNGKIKSLQGESKDDTLTSILRTAKFLAEERG